jgi:P-type conjugative transfer protein TrbJ
MLRRMILTVASIGVLTLGLVQVSHAQLTVIDPANLLKNTITAGQQVKSEVYQNTNIVYQYQMMLNQLKQATNLNPAAMMSQFNTITSDINSYSRYADTLKSLYGGLQDNAQYLTKVQSLVTQSGKTPDQWFNDQSTLVQNNDKTAKALFQQGADVQAHVQTLATRRQDIQNQLSLAPTQQATAELTTHMLDIVASQNSDMLQMMASKQQKDATAMQAQAATDAARTEAQKTLSDKQDQERAALENQVFSATKLGH